jgi:hypothetical protein
MDNSFPQQASDTQQAHGFRVVLQILDRLEAWLAHLAQIIQLTEDEQEDAGIFLRQLTEEEQNDAGSQLGDQRYG